MLLSILLCAMPLAGTATAHFSQHKDLGIAVQTPRPRSVITNWDEASGILQARSKKNSGNKSNSNKYGGKKNGGNKNKSHKKGGKKHNGKKNSSNKHGRKNNSSRKNSKKKNSANKKGGNKNSSLAGPKGSGKGVKGDKAMQGEQATNSEKGSKSTKGAKELSTEAVPKGLGGVGLGTIGKKGGKGEKTSTKGSSPGPKDLDGGEIGNKGSKVEKAKGQKADAGGSESKSLEPGFKSKPEKESKSKIPEPSSTTSASGKQAKSGLAKYLDMGMGMLGGKGQKPGDAGGKQQSKSGLMGMASGFLRGQYSQFGSSAAAKFLPKGLTQFASQFNPSQKQAIAGAPAEGGAKGGEADMASHVTRSEHVPMQKREWHDSSGPLTRRTGKGSKSPTMSKISAGLIGIHSGGITKAGTKSSSQMASMRPNIEPGKADRVPTSSQQSSANNIPPAIPKSNPIPIPKSIPIPIPNPTPAAKQPIRASQSSKFVSRTKSKALLSLSGVQEGRVEKNGMKGYNKVVLVEKKNRRLISSLQQGSHSTPETSKALSVEKDNLDIGRKRKMTEMREGQDATGSGAFVRAQDARKANLAKQSRQPDTSNEASASPPVSPRPFQRTSKSNKDLWALGAE